MDGELIILAIIFLVVGVVSLYGKITSRKAAKNRDDLLKTLHKFEIPLDSIKINGTYWQESVPVDINANELDANDPFLYGRGSFGAFSTTINGYHKQKNKTKFSTKLHIKIPYLNKKYKFSTNLPIEDTNVRIKFYLKKTIDVYVEKSVIIRKDKEVKATRFLLDFRFLENENVTIISTNYYYPKFT